MKIKTILKRIGNKSIKFRGRHFLFYTYRDGSKYTFCIEHLIDEPNDLLIYTETITNKTHPKESIDFDLKQQVIAALLDELTMLEYKFIIDRSVPPKF